MGPVTPEAPLPPRKQIGIKTARRFMEEVISALSQEEAKKQLDNASADKAVRSYPQKLFQKAGPIVEKLVAGLTEKYEFHEGFGQAMQSVHEAQKRKDDPAVKTLLETFQKLISMQEPAEDRKEGKSRDDVSDDSEIVN